MRASLIVTTVLGAAAALAMVSPPAFAAFENCYTVRATADGRNPEVSLRRAENRLHRHIADELRSSTGKTVSPVSTQCIRNACKASAIVCQH
jgi:hypothetical protein